MLLWVYPFIWLLAWSTDLKIRILVYRILGICKCKGIFEQIMKYKFLLLKEWFSTLMFCIRRIFINVEYISISKRTKKCCSLTEMCSNLEINFCAASTRTARSLYHGHNITIPVINVQELLTQPRTPIRLIDLLNNISNLRSVAYIPCISWPKRLFGRANHGCNLLVLMKSCRPTQTHYSDSE